MAEQRGNGTGGRKSGSTSKKTAAAGVNELREALSSLIDPLGMVMLTRVSGSKTRSTTPSAAAASPPTTPRTSSQA
jgi:hypothetical protein